MEWICVHVTKPLLVTGKWNRRKAGGHHRVIPRLAATSLGKKKHPQQQWQTELKWLFIFKLCQVISITAGKFTRGNLAATHTCLWNPAQITVVAVAAHKDWSKGVLRMNSTGHYTTYAFLFPLLSAIFSNGQKLCTYDAHHSLHFSRALTHNSSTLGQNTSCLTALLYAIMSPHPRKHWITSLSL